MTNRLHYLLKQHIAKTATTPEREELFAAATSDIPAGEWQTSLEGLWDGFSTPERLDDAHAAAIFERIAKHTMHAPVVHRVHFLKTAWFRYAALLLLIAGTATYLYTSSSWKDPKVSQIKQAPQPQDIPPGGNKAILTLSDGSTIILDSAANGSLAQQGNTKILKLNAGSLAYKATSAHSETGFNTISTPRGGQYHISLPDGSNVWLNAASSIRFPTAFASDRKVTITGEVYFDIAPDKSKPFSVTANGTRVDVLGTRFNINAYTDEPTVKTSLLEGSVKIENTILKPGQAYTNGKIVATNMTQDIAWKNGLFTFSSARVPEVMRQLARWYDIEIVYEGAIPAMTFEGGIPRKLPLSDVLDVLKQSELKYRLEGRKLIILP